MLPAQDRADRIAGCLLAGALGDAIGAHFEGRPLAGEYRLPTELRVTDDTQLTIATCESLVESRGVDPESVARHFLRWFRDGRITGIGSSTLKSLNELDAGGHWALVGATGERSAGNGAAMRVAPLAFVLDPDVERDRQVLRDVCRITHRNDEAYVGALTIVRTIRYVLAERSLDVELISHLAATLPDSIVRDRLLVLRRTRLSPAEYVAQFGATGFVADSVPLAILVATQAAGLLEGIRQAVACGGDTDTIASMFGHIFGATHGRHVLPHEIIEQIDAASQVREIAEKLSRSFFSIA